MGADLEFAAPGGWMTKHVYYREGAVVRCFKVGPREKYWHSPTPETPDNPEWEIALPTEAAATDLMGDLTWGERF